MTQAYHHTGNAFRRLRAIVPELVDPETGVITYVQELPRQNDMPDFIYYKAEIADTGIFGLKTNRPATGGTSLDRDRAIAKAIGEAVERYCSAIYFPSSLLLASYQEIEGAAIHPSRFHLHREEQMKHSTYPLVPFDAETPVRWVHAVRWSTQSQVWVPAAAVYCPYIVDNVNGEAFVMETISTGIAAHCSIEEAAMNAILEVVERDSFMCHWMTSASCPVIDEASLEPLHHEMLARLAIAGYCVQIVYAKADHGIPTVIGLMHGGRPGCVPFTVSAATHLDTSSAITKALEELALLERLSQRVLITATRKRIQDYSHITRLIDHLRFWMDPQVLPESHFLADQDRVVKLDKLPALSSGTPAGDLSLIVRRIEETGHDVLICDVTTEDIMSLGMSVVRAVVPGFVPLTVRYDCRPEGSVRLNQFLTSGRSTRNGGSGINTLPHPFA